MERILVGKTRNLLWLFAFVCLISTGVQASEAKLHAEIDELADKIYTTSETSGADLDAYEKALKEKAEEIDGMLKKYPEASLAVTSKGGMTPLHEAASMGFYSVVEVLLRDRRFREVLNARTEAGYTALDLAKMRMRILMPFYRPMLSQNIFAFIPFMVTQGFYNGELQPYRKTIAALEKHDAQVSGTMKENIHKLLETRKASLLKLRSRVEDDSKKNEKLEKVIKLVKDRQEKLASFPDNEEALVEAMARESFSMMMLEDSERHLTPSGKPVFPSPFRPPLSP